MNVLELFACFNFLKDHDLLDRGLTYAEQRRAFTIHQTLHDDDEGREVAQQYIQALQRRPKAIS